MLGHFCKAKLFIIPIFPSRYVITTVFLQVCGCIESKKLIKVLLFNILIRIANIESLFLFRFLIMVTVLLFTDFLIFSIYNMMLRLVVILLIRLSFEGDFFIWLVEIFLRRIMK